MCHSTHVCMQRCFSKHAHVLFHACTHAYVLFMHAYYNIYMCRHSFCINDQAWMQVCAFPCMPERTHIRMNMCFPCTLVQPSSTFTLTIRHGRMHMCFSCIDASHVLSMHVRMHIHKRMHSLILCLLYKAARILVGRP